MHATVLEGNKVGYKEFRRGFKLLLPFKYLRKFICFAEADFMIKQVFISPSLSAEKADRKEALWLFNLLSRGFPCLVTFFTLG